MNELCSRHVAETETGEGLLCYVCSDTTSNHSPPAADVEQAGNEEPDIQDQIESLEDSLFKNTDASAALSQKLLSTVEALSGLSQTLREVNEFAEEFQAEQQRRFHEAVDNIKYGSIRGARKQDKKLYNSLVSRVALRKEQKAKVATKKVRAWEATDI